MDKFKEYLNQHADELGNDEPGARVWENLQKDMPVAGKIKAVTNWYKYAAAACLLALVLLGIWFFKFNDVPKVTPPAITKVEPRPAVKRIPDISRKEITAVKPVKNIKRSRIAVAGALPENSELRSVEASFTTVINLERHKINRTPLLAEDRAYFDYFKTRFRKINGDEEQLKKEIREHGFTDDMLQQLISIYQQKLNILKDLQTEINKTNNLVQQDMQPTEIKHRSYINI